jgi:hypothetical protein
MSDQKALRLIATKMLDLVDEHIPEGIHTAFRKAGTSASANDAWHAIRRMSGHEWGNVCSWATSPHRNMWMEHNITELGALLDKAGYQITKKETTNV